MKSKKIAAVLLVVKLIIRILLLPVRISLTIVQLRVLFVFSERSRYEII